MTDDPQPQEARNRMASLTVQALQSAGYDLARDQDEPDAHLTDAAPDLLEALDWLLGCVEADPADERHPDIHAERLALAKAAARKAIAKATGAQS